MWITISIIFSVVIAVFMVFALGTIKDFMDTRKTERIFVDLIKNGLSDFEALVEVSRIRYPELSLETHLQIVTKFPSLDEFLGFMIYAFDIDYGKKAKLSEREILALIKTTTLINKGHGVYTAKTDRESYYKILNKK